MAVFSTFFDMVLSGEKRPHMEWRVDSENGTIDLEVDEKPEWARVNWAYTWNNERRDFRMFGPAENCNSLLLGDMCLELSFYKSETL